MEAKEIAKCLVDKFRNYVDSEIVGEQQFEYSKEQETNLSKKCALIAIDEIALKTRGHHKDAILTNFIEYWQDVKKEVQAII